MSSTEQPLNPLAALHVFAAHLEARARAGQERIWMSPEARTALKEICRMKPGRMVFTAPAPLTPTPTPAPDTRETGESTPEGTASPTRSEKEAALAEVARRAEVSPKARSLGTLRDIMVFATGNPEAEIMFVGEAPGSVEEKMREPFTGPAGATLDRILKAMALERSQVYISNICKFRPAIEGAGQGSKNRKPTAEEMESCLEYVHEEIAIIRPRVIIALGGTAAEGLLRKPIAVTRARGQWMECQGIPLMITFHPSYILRKEEEGEEIANAEKRKLWEDMLKVMERAGMEVSEKQRRYFLLKAR
jgi:uracil-DNA glycosylase family 4